MEPTEQKFGKSDGTDAGTVMIKNINTGINSSDPAYLTVINGIVYFAANDGSNGNELWKTDGTEAGTVMVKNINTVGNQHNPTLLTNVNGILYFYRGLMGLKEMNYGNQNGTEAGTSMVKGSQPGNQWQQSCIAYQYKWHSLFFC
jgi:ELWxxDGT repeat protein